MNEAQLATKIGNATVIEMLMTGMGMADKANAVLESDLQVVFCIGDWQSPNGIWFNMELHVSQWAKKNCGIKNPTNEELVAWMIEQESIAWVQVHAVIVAVEV